MMRDALFFSVFVFQERAGKGYIHVFGKVSKTVPPSSLFMNLNVITDTFYETLRDDRS